MLYGFKKYNMDQVEKRIKKAISEYKRRGGAEGKVIVSSYKLPRLISPDGKVVDLEQKYKGYKIIAEMIGLVPALLYVDKKRLINGKEKDLKFMHFLKKPAYLVFDPEDPERIFIVFGSGVRMTESGVIG